MGVISDPLEKLKIKTVVSDLAVRLLLALARQFPNEILSMLPVMEDIFMDTCQVMDYNYDDLRMYFNPKQIAFFIKEGIASHSPKSQNHLLFKGLIWTDKGNIDLLAYELKKRDCIKDKKQWVGLFDASREPSRVAFNRDFMGHLAHLLFYLHKEGYITTKGTKGYFALVEGSLKDYSNKLFAKNSLKRLSSKINSNPSRYAGIISDVKNIVAKTHLRTKGL